MNDYKQGFDNGIDFGLNYLQERTGLQFKDLNEVGDWILESRRALQNGAKVLKELREELDG